MGLIIEKELPLSENDREFRDACIEHDMLECAAENSHLEDPQLESLRREFVTALWAFRAGLGLR